MQTQNCGSKLRLFAGNVACGLGKAIIFAIVLGNFTRRRLLEPCTSESHHTVEQIGQWQTWALSTFLSRAFDLRRARLAATRGFSSSIFQGWIVTLLET